VYRNSRVIAKIIQLIELKNHSSADKLDKEGRIAAKIDRYKKKLNKRLKICANWSDERVSSRMPDRFKLAKIQSQYKQQWNDQRYIDAVANKDSNSNEQGNIHLKLSTGSENSYTEEYNSQLLEKGEISIITRVATTTTSNSNQYQSSGIGGSDPMLYRGAVDTWKYLDQEEITHLETTDPDELKRRRRLDSDHRYYMKKKAGL
jgi:hypothetical protein